jgi:hypothetical protein
VSIQWQVGGIETDLGSDQALQLLKSMPGKAAFGIPEEAVMHEKKIGPHHTRPLDYVGTGIYGDCHRPDFGRTLHL